MLLALVAATVAQPQARATARILPAARITQAEWSSAPRKREIVVNDQARRLTVRLIEFE